MIEINASRVNANSLMSTFFSVFSKEIREIGHDEALKKYLPTLIQYTPNVMIDPEGSNTLPKEIPGALLNDTLEGNLRRHLFGEKSRVELAREKFKAKRSK